MCTSRNLGDVSALIFSFQREAPLVFTISSSREVYQLRLFQRELRAKFSGSVLTFSVCFR